MEKMNLSINLEKADEFHAVAEAMRQEKRPELSHDEYVDLLFTGFVRDYCAKVEA